MRTKIKRYKVSPDESLCLAVSVVNAPAVESNFQFFSEQKLEKFVGVEGERRMIYGCALRPDFPIYRNNGEEEYYLEFDKEAIDKISKNYFKMGFQSNWTEAHKNEVEGLTITESWIKESMTLDKSVALGLDPELPIGSWLIGCHCENDEIWQKVKEGTYHGFSCEAIVGLEEFESQINKINDKNNIMEIDEMSFWNKMKDTLSEVFTSLSMSKKDEAQTEENEVETIKAELEENAQPTEPTVEPSEPTVTEPTVETPKVYEPKADEPKADEPKADEPKADGNTHLEDLVNSLKAEIEALKTTNNELATKVNDLSKQPSVKPINTNANPNANGDAYQAWRDKMRSML